MNETLGQQRQSELTEAGYQYGSLLKVIQAITDDIIASTLSRQTSLHGSL